MSNPSDISKAMLEAVLRGNPKIVKNLISLYGLNYSDEWSEGYRLLCEAILGGHKKVAKLLIKTGAKINFRGDKGFIFKSNTPLHLAVFRSDMELVKMLLDRNADIEAKNEEEQTLLHIAIATENEKIVSLFLNRGAYVNPVDCHDLTPLHYACFRDDGKLVELLLENGAEVNRFCRLRDNERPLHAASQYGFEESVRTLLKFGADPNVRDTDKATPLHFAAENGFLNIAELLLKSFADVNAVNNLNHTPLFLAVEKQSLPLVECILRHSPSVNIEYNRKSLRSAVCNFGEESGKIVECLTHYGFSLDPEDACDSDLLYAAVYGGYLKLVEFLLSYEANPNITVDNLSLLNAAVSLGDESIVKLLLDAGCLLNVPDYSGKKPVDCSVIHSKNNNDAGMLKLLISHGAFITDTTYKLLHEAVKRLNLEICEVLIENGADINEYDDCDRTALMYTALKDDDIYVHPVVNNYQLEYRNTTRWKIAKTLLSRGANVNAKSEFDQTTLHMAASNGFQSLVYLILQYEVDIHAVDADNRTSLHMAVLGGHERVTEILLEHGAIVNALDIFGETPIEMAIGAGFINIIEILLKRGASIDLMKDDLPLLHFLAKRSIRSETISVLIKHGADVNAKAKNNLTPLHFATQEGLEDTVEALLKNGANIDAVSSNGATPLHIAAFDGNLEIVEDLLKFDADINLKDGAGMTPLHLAAYKKHSVIVQILLENGADINLMCNVGMTPINLVKSSLNEADLGVVNYTLRDCSENDSDTEDNWIRETIRAFEYHKIKLKMANYYICPKNIGFEESQSENLESYLLFAHECMKETARMSNILLDLPFTLNHILSTNRSLLYTRNKAAMDAFKNINLKTFPIYRRLIKRNIKDDTRRIVLLKSGLCKESFDTLTRTSNALNANKLAFLPTELVEEIFSFLSRKDLERLLSCSQNLERQLKKTKGNVNKKCYC